jgi:hypothetical protein
MSSHLRLQSSFEPFEAQALYQQSPSSPSAKKQKMSLTRTYAVASTARSKLGREASRSDHNLRRLVGHANLLDTLMVELADAEREQEAWFHQATKTEEPRHIQWIDTIQEDFDEESEDDSDNESDAGSDIYDEDAELYNTPLRKMRSPPIIVESLVPGDEEYDEEYDEEDDEDHALIRVPSKHSPPELLLDDSDSEDDSMPPSPEQEAPLEFNAAQVKEMTAAALFVPKSQSSIEDYIMQDAQQPLIAAC